MGVRVKLRDAWKQLTLSSPSRVALRVGYSTYSFERRSGQKRAQSAALARCDLCGCPDERKEREVALARPVLEASLGATE